MQPLDYSSANRRLVVAKNLPFRVCFSVMGAGWNLLHCVAQLNAFAVRSEIGLALTIPGARLSPTGQVIFEYRLYEIAGGLGALCAAGLFLLSVYLFAHAVRNWRRPDSRIIPWPRRYWWFKVPLSLALILCLFAQWRFVVRFAEDLAGVLPYSTSVDSTGSAFVLVLCLIGLFFGLTPILAIRESVPLRPSEQ